MYKKDNPWLKTYGNIQKRCNLPSSHRNYRFYGGRGVKNLLTVKDLKFLWKRDHADKLKRPSIDRIDPMKGYTIENCRYIEFKQNCRLAILNHKQIEYGVTKVCRKCEETKPIDDFRFKGIKHLPHLRHNACYQCKSKYDRIRALAKSLSGA